MVKSCVAFHCTQRAGKGVTFHCFPKETNLKKRWILAVRRDKWKPTASSLLCHRHFKADDYSTSGWSTIKKLKHDAVPSVFDFPAHMVPKAWKRSSPKKRPSPKKSPEKSSVQSEQETCNEEQDEPSVDSILNSDMCPVVDNSISEQAVTDISESGPPERTRKKRTHYVGDFAEGSNGALAKAKETIEKKNKLLKLVRQRTNRMQKKITELQDLVSHLKEKYSATETAVQNLLSSVPEECRKIFTQMLAGQLRGKAYPHELRCFAITLDFYSPKAYDYVRSTFNKCLPHRRTIQKWFQTVSGTPGFSTEAMAALKMKVKDAKQRNRPVVCSIMFDEMSIRKKLDYTGSRIVGYVDVGGGCSNNDETPLAKEALVFLVNCLNGSWKMPVGYFLINGITAEEKTNLVLKCLDLLHQIGIDAVSVTFDGLHSNQAMCKLLGGSLSIERMEPWFPHPVTGKKVFLFPDPCHMMKLVRNAFASLGTIYHQGSAIQWSYLTHLVELQNSEGLHLANKLRSRHLNWEKEKMKVRVAAQTLSRSVAKALQFLRVSKKGGFQNTEATEVFLETIDAIFDILNARNALAPGLKGGLKPTNISLLREQIKSYCTYLSQLQDANGEKLIASRKKTGFVGLIVALNALVFLFDEICSGGDGSLMTYLLSYKMSQDHIETFFSAVRSRGGFNNNPSALQLEGAMKRLVIHAHLKGSSNGNCLNDLKCTESEFQDEQPTPTVTNEPDLLHQDHDYVMSFPFESTTEYADECIKYIAGFVVKMVIRRVKCPTCLEALEGTAPPLLVQIKYYVPGRGLKCPSADVIHLCLAAEKIFKSSAIKDVAKMTIDVIKSLTRNVFQNLHFHQFDDEPLGNHVVQLVPSNMWNPTHVQVTVLKAKNLLIKGKGGCNNPLVTIAVGKEKYQTSVKENTGSEPVVWQEQCELSLSHSDNTTCIVLTVLHRGIVDQFLGTISIPLASLAVHDRPKSRWYKLEAKANKKEEKGMVKDRGELEVRISFTVRASTGSLMDLSKKEKHKSSVGQLSAKFGGSLMSLGSSDKRLGLKKIVKNLGKKVGSKKRDANGGDGASEKGSVENVTFPPNIRKGGANADPGVASDDDDDDEFALDNLSYKSSESSLTNCPILENLAGGELLRRSKKAPSKPPLITSPEMEQSIGNMNEWEEKLCRRSGETLMRGHRVSPTFHMSPILTKASTTDEVTSPYVNPFTPSPKPPERRFTSSPNLQKQDSREMTLSEESKESSKITKTLKQIQGFIKDKKDERFIIGEECGDGKKMDHDEEASRHPPEVLNMFRNHSRDDLIATVLELKTTLQLSERLMKETEEYLDNLLVRVMETSPRILQGPINASGRSGFKSK